MPPSQPGCVLLLLTTAAHQPRPLPVQGEQRTHLDCDVFFPLCHHQAYGRRVMVMIIKSIMHRSQAVLHKLKHLPQQKHQITARDSGGQGSFSAKQASRGLRNRPRLLLQVPQPSVPRTSLCKHVFTVN